jgi:hypothetical protein
MNYSLYLLSDLRSTYLHTRSDNLSCIQHLITFSCCSSIIQSIDYTLNIEQTKIQWDSIKSTTHLVLCIPSKFISLVPSTLTWYPSRDRIRQQLKHIPEFQLETIHSFLFLLDLIPPSISLKRKRELRSISSQRRSKDNSSITKKLKSLSLD